MHKKLAADLTSLAHSILQMKNKEDVFALQKKAHEVYEKLSVLAYVEEYINNTPNPEHTKEELIEKIEEVAAKAEESIVEEEIIRHELEEIAEAKEEEEIEEEIEVKEVEQEEKIEEVVEPEAEQAEEVVEEGTVEEVQETEEKEEEIVEPTAEEVEEPEPIVEEKEEEVIEAQEELFPTEEEIIEEEKEEEKPSLENELQDTIAVDVVADLFENAPKKSLNDKLHGDIQIGLNDRIAFVKNLFDGSQEDFNRVVSQLNTFKTEKEAKKFISKMVKPDYDWTEKEEFEERFMNIVERKFL
ncbi:hypothetical protein [Pseudotenacibaculum haliotis]|uniref:Uncharacterized protein n=1 Tax=Pseudotenacibaculum haliotis TaxID=1862138 RepID=A0ABW5LX21_9FLAO